MLTVRRFPLLPLLALAGLASLALPVSAHVFHPSPFVGVDVFLDQGPALIEVDGGTCKAEHVMSSGDATIAVPGFANKTAQMFFLPVFGMRAGITTVTIQVNDGTMKVGGDTLPCGEGGTQYVFEVRVWPDRETFEKKLEAILVHDLKTYTTATNETISNLVKAVQQTVADYKAGLFDDNSPPLAVSHVLQVTLQPGFVAGQFAQLNTALIKLSTASSEQLVACGFAEGFVVDAGFLPTAAQSGAAGKVAQQMKQFASSLAKTVASFEKSQKKALGTLIKLAAQQDVTADANLSVNMFAVPSALPAYDTTGLLVSPDALHVSAAASYDVWGLEPMLEVAGLGPPDSDVSLQLFGAMGQRFGGSVAHTDADGVFSQTFDKGVPRGQDLRIELEHDGRVTSFNTTIANATGH